VEIQAIQEENVLVVKISGRLDAVTAPEYESKVALLVAGASRVVVDFQELEYVSSAGLRALLMAGKPLKATGGQMRFANVNGSVKEVFHITGFTSIFPIDASLAESVAAFS